MPARSFIHASRREGGPALVCLIEDRCGVTAIEYALIAAQIAVAAIAAFTLTGTNLSKTFSSVASQL